MNSGQRFETAIAPANYSRIYTALLVAALGFMCYRLGSTASHAHLLFLLLGILLLATAGGLAFSSESFVLDKAGSRYRSALTLLGFSSSSWQPLPAISGVTMKYFSEYPIADKRRWQTNNPHEYYIVMLSMQTANQRGIVVSKFTFRQKPQALRLAEALATYLDVPVKLYDAPE